MYCPNPLECVPFTVNVRKMCLLRSLGQAFYSTAQELLHDNGDAFRAARRQSPLPGRQAPRIVHARKFWNALSDVATYWDTSLDSYSDNDTDKKGNDAMDIDQLRTEAQHDNEMDLDNKSSEEKKSEDNPNKTKTTYTGRRTDTGRNMYVLVDLFHCSSFVFYTEFEDAGQLQGLFSPCCTLQICLFACDTFSRNKNADSKTCHRPRKYREDMVAAFVEMFAWAFSCRLEQATIQPRIQLHGMTFPLPHVASVYRTPKDARRARSGILEGPLLAVSCRDHPRYRDPGQAVGEGAFEIMDLLRETGLMAMLALKRTREGKEEVQPGAGKWWTTTPRWGGGPGGECGIVEEEAMEDVAQEVSGPQRKRAKKSTQADVWRAMHPPKSTWEKGISYQQIGKDKGSVYDDVSYIVISTYFTYTVIHTNNPPTP